MLRIKEIIAFCAVSLLLGGCMKDDLDGRAYPSDERMQIALSRQNDGCRYVSVATDNERLIGDAYVLVFGTGMTVVVLANTGVASFPSSLTAGVSTDASVTWNVRNLAQKQVGTIYNPDYETQPLTN